MSNRVDELESRVAELQAAVDGLTEELVETRERLRALEAGDAPDGGPARNANETVTPRDGEDETVDADADGDPDDPAESPADVEPAEGSTSESNSNSDSDDIIVA